MLILSEAARFLFFQNILRWNVLPDGEQIPSVQRFHVVCSSTIRPAGLSSMALQQTDGGETKEAPSKAGGQPKDPLRWIASVDTSQRSAVSFSQHSPPSSSTQRIVPGNCPENSRIVREALLMNLPHHLVLHSAQLRAQTNRTSYSDVKELVADMFAARNGSCSAEDQEVPMETNQLEEALMMNTAVVKKALQTGAPPHLLKPLVREKILSNQVGYTEVSELLRDLNSK